ncbi:glycosyltransferase [Streptomyces sp. NPDC059215]|uniref:glycosyltransferase n=1 Tax=Streptomyces sp. NPDC059215 TaxID=3346772 RepID=UPI0036CA5B91
MGYKTRSMSDPPVQNVVTDVLLEGHQTRPDQSVSTASTSSEHPDVVGVDGRVVSDSEVVSHPVGESVARQSVGSASYTDVDWAHRAGRVEAFAISTTYRDLILGSGASGGVVGAVHAVAWKGSGATFFAGHGTATRVALARRDGTTFEVSGRELGRYLLRTQDLGPASVPVVLYACETGRQPAHGGLSVAQHVANLTRRTVYAPTTDTGSALDGEGRALTVLTAEADASPGTWAGFAPEPAGRALEDLARAAGLHLAPETPDPWTTTRTLQLVRTLRGTFGVPVETSDDYHALLRGLAALDRLRWNSTTDVQAARHTDARMTPGVLRRISRDILDLPEHAQQAPDTWRSVLTAATTIHTAGQDAPLNAIKHLLHTTQAHQTNPQSKDIRQPYPSQADARSQTDPADAVEASRPPSPEPETPRFHQAGQPALGLKDPLLDNETLRYIPPEEESEAEITDSDPGDDLAYFKDLSGHMGNTPVAEGEYADFLADRRKWESIARQREVVRDRLEAAQQTDPAFMGSDHDVAIIVELTAQAKELRDRDLTPLLNESSETILHAMNRRTDRMIAIMEENPSSMSSGMEEYESWNSQATILQVAYQSRFVEEQLLHIRHLQPASDAGVTLGPGMSERHAQRMLVADRRSSQFRESDVAILTSRIMSADWASEYREGLEGEYLDEVLAYTNSLLTATEHYDLVNNFPFAQIVASAGKSINPFVVNTSSRTSEGSEIHAVNPAAMVSARFQKDGDQRSGAAVVRWKKSVRERSVFTPFHEGSNGPAGDLLHGSSRRSLYPLLAFGDDRALRLAMAEATQFRYDSELLWELKAGRPAADSYFGALILGDLNWADVASVDLTFHDTESEEEARLTQNLLLPLGTEHAFPITLSRISPPLPAASGTLLASNSSGASHSQTPLANNFAHGPVIVLDFTPMSRRPKWWGQPIIADKTFTTDVFDGVQEEVEDDQAPWSVGGQSDSVTVPELIFLKGTREDGHVVADSETGIQHFSAAEFAQALTDNAVMRSVPQEAALVLLIPYAGSNDLSLPRLIASRTGRPVWSTSSDVELFPGPEGFRRITQRAHGMDRTTRYWHLSRPTDLGPTGNLPRPGLLLTTDRDIFLTTDVATHTLGGEQQIGRSAHDEKDEGYRGRIGSRDRNAFWLKTSYSQRGRGDSGGKIPTDTERPLPWRRESDQTQGEPYFFNTHGLPGLMRLNTRNQKLLVNQFQAVNFLKSRPSIQNLSAERPLVLAICHAGNETAAGGPSLAQTVADHTRHVVFGAPERIYDDLSVMRQLDGTPTLWTRHTPKALPLVDRAADVSEPSEEIQDSVDYFDFFTQPTGPDDSILVDSNEDATNDREARYPSGSDSIEDYFTYFMEPAGKEDHTPAGNNEYAVGDNAQNILLESADGQNSEDDSPDLLIQDVSERSSVFSSDTSGEKTVEESSLGARHDSMSGDGGNRSRLREDYEPSDHGLLSEQPAGDGRVHQTVQSAASEMDSFVLIEANHEAKRLGFDQRVMPDDLEEYRGYLTGPNSRKKGQQLAQFVFTSGPVRMVGGTPRVPLPGPPRGAGGQTDDSEGVSADVQQPYRGLPLPTGPELARWRGSLTGEQEVVVLGQIVSYLNDWQFSAARVLSQRLAGRAAELHGTNGHAAAVDLHLRADRIVRVHTDMYLDPFIEPHENLRDIPKSVNFIWVGGPMKSEAVANVIRWADQGARAGWQVSMWTDTTAGPGGEPLSHWDRRAKEALMSRGVVFREITQLLPLVRPLETGYRRFWYKSATRNLSDVTLVKLRDIYEVARTDRRAAPAASDAVRYAVLFSEGGVYVDVDIAPGAVDLRRVPRRMAVDDVPVLAPLIRDTRQLRFLQADIATKSGRNPQQVSVREVAHDLTSRAEFGNSFLLAPQGSGFLQHLVDAIPDDILSMTGDELVGSAAFMTGPLAIPKVLYSQMKSYGLGITTPGEMAAAADPSEVLRWSMLDWITAESDNQEYDRQPMGRMPVAQAAIVTDILTERGAPHEEARHAASNSANELTGGVKRTAPSDSTMSGPHDVVAVDGRVVSDSEVVSRPLVGSVGRRPIGSASYTDADWVKRADRLKAVTANTTYQDLAGGVVGAVHAVAWKGSGATFFAGHGTATRVALARRDGTTFEVSGRELGRYLLRTQDLGPASVPVVLYACETGRQPAHGGLSVAQHVANLTRRTVYAPTTDTGSALDGEGRALTVLTAEADASPGTWAGFAPEPAGRALEDLARAAGLHLAPETPDPWTTTRTLQLVRTLRGTFGVPVETSDDYHALLRGLAALDRLRWNSTTDVQAARHTDARMTPGVLRRISRDILDLPEHAQQAPDTWRSVLTAATTIHTAGQDAPLNAIKHLLHTTQAHQTPGQRREATPVPSSRVDAPPPTDSAGSLTESALPRTSQPVVTNSDVVGQSSVSKPAPLRATGVSSPKAPSGADRDEKEGDFFETDLQQWNMIHESRASVRDRLKDGGSTEVRGAAATEPRSTDEEDAHEIVRLTRLAMELRDRDLGSLLQRPVDDLERGITVRERRITALAASSKNTGRTQAVDQELDAWRQQAHKLGIAVRHRARESGLARRDVFSTSELEYVENLISRAQRPNALALAEADKDFSVRLEKRGFKRLTQPTGLWKRVSKDRAVDLVLSELNSRLSQGYDRASAIDRLFGERWATSYRQSGNRTEIIEKAQEHLVRESALVSNVRLGSVLRDGRSVRDALTQSARMNLGGLLGSVGDGGNAHGGVLRAALVSKHFQRFGDRRAGGAVVRWSDDVRGRTVYTPSPANSDLSESLQHGSTSSSLYSLLAYGNEDAVRLVVGEATDFRHDLDPLWATVAGTLAADAHFGALILGDLSWKDVSGITLTYWDDASYAQASEDAVVLRNFARMHTFTFDINFAQDSQHHVPETGSAAPASHDAQGRSVTGEQLIATSVVHRRATVRDYTPLHQRTSPPSLGLETTNVYESRPDTVAGAPGYTLQPAASPSPWTPYENKSGHRPLFVQGLGMEDGVIVQLLDGQMRKVRAEEFADVLTNDPIIKAAPSNIPLVLLISHAGKAGLVLPRLLANKTGRSVWAFSGELATVSIDRKYPPVIAQRGWPDFERPIDTWTISEPGEQVGLDATSPNPPLVLTRSGDVLLSSDIATYTISDRRHRSVGLASTTQGDASRRGKFRDGLSEIENFYLGDVVNKNKKGQFAGFSTLAPIRDSGKRVPWADGPTPYFVNIHGNSENVKLATTRDRLVEVDGRQFARFLINRPSLIRLPKEAPVVLISCQAGNSSLGGENTVSQLVANEIGRIVYAPTTKVGGQFTLIRKSENGASGEWRRFAPLNSTAQGDLEPGGVVKARTASASKTPPYASVGGGATSILGTPRSDVDAETTEHGDNFAPETSGSGIQRTGPRASGLRSTTAEGASPGSAATADAVSETNDASSLGGSTPSRRSRPAVTNSGVAGQSSGSTAAPLWGSALSGTDGDVQQGNLSAPVSWQRVTQGPIPAASAPETEPLSLHAAVLDTTGVTQGSKDGIADFVGETEPASDMRTAANREDGDESDFFIDPDGIQGSAVDTGDAVGDAEDHGDIRVTVGESNSKEVDFFVYPDSDQGSEDYNADVVNVAEHPEGILTAVGGGDHDESDFFVDPDAVQDFYNTDRREWESIARLRDDVRDRLRVLQRADPAATGSDDDVVSMVALDARVVHLKERDLTSLSDGDSETIRQAIVRRQNRMREIAVSNPPPMSTARKEYESWEKQCAFLLIAFSRRAVEEEILGSRHRYSIDRLSTESLAGVKEAHAQKIRAAEVRSSKFVESDRSVIGVRVSSEVWGSEYPRGVELNRILTGVNASLNNEYMLVSDIPVAQLAAAMRDSEGSSEIAFSSMLGVEGNVTESPAVLISASYQMQGNRRLGGAAVHWKREVKNRSVFVPSHEGVNGPGGDLLHGSQSESLYPLLAFGDSQIVRLAMAEATDFQHDPDLRWEMAGGRPVIDSHFGALILGNLNWSDIASIELTFHDAKSQQEAALAHEAMAPLRTKHGFSVTLMRASPPPTAVIEESPRSGREQDNNLPLASSIAFGPVTALDYTPMARRSPLWERPIDPERIYLATPVANGVFDLHSIPARWVADDETAMASRPFPLFVTGIAEGTRVVVESNTGIRHYESAEFADALAANDVVRRLPPGVPIVLLISRAGSNGLALPRLIAARTGRSVWSFSSNLELLTGRDDVRLISQPSNRDRKHAGGDWYLSHPADLGLTGDLPRPALLLTASGDILLDSAVSTHSIGGGRHVGRSSLSEAEQADHQEWQEEYQNVDNYFQNELVGDEYRQIKGTGQILPWVRDGKRPYFFNAHGSPGKIGLTSAEDTVAKFDGAQIGNFLRRRPSIQSLPNGNPIVLVACHAGANVPEGVSVAQHVADFTQRVVFGVPGIVTSDLSVLQKLNRTSTLWRKFAPRGKAGADIGLATKSNPGQESGSPDNPDPSLGQTKEEDADVFDELSRTASQSIHSSPEAAPENDLAGVRDSEAAAPSEGGARSNLIQRPLAGNRQVTSADPDQGRHGDALRDRGTTAEPIDGPQPSASSGSGETGERIFQALISTSSPSNTLGMPASAAPAPKQHVGVLTQRPLPHQDREAEPALAHTVGRADLDSASNGHGLVPAAPRRGGAKGSTPPQRAGRQEKADASASAAPAVDGYETTLHDRARFTPEFRVHADHYELSPVAQFDGSAKGSLKPGEEIRFIATVAASLDPKDDLKATAEQYAAAFGESAQRGERLGLVIGLNGRPGTEKQIVAKLDEFARYWSAHGTFAVSVTGFTWHQPDPTLRAGGSQKEVPYGAIREAIIRDELTRNMIASVSEGGGPVYLHIGDADVQDMALGEPLFDRAARNIDAMKVGTDDRTQLPEAVIGGYTLNDSTQARSAADLDLKVRRAMGGVADSSVYPTEPNLFVRLDTESYTGLESDIHFGFKDGDKWRFEALEGRHLVRSLIKSRKPMWDAATAPKMVRYDADLTLRTHGGRVAQKVQNNHASIVRDLAQSHANKGTWTDQIRYYLQEHHPDAFGRDVRLAEALAGLAFHKIDTVDTTLFAMKMSELAAERPADANVLRDAVRGDKAAFKLLGNMVLAVRNALVDGINGIILTEIAPSRPSAEEPTGEDARPVPPTPDVPLEARRTAEPQAQESGEELDRPLSVGRNPELSASWHAARREAPPQVVRGRNWVDPISRRGRSEPFSGPIRANAGEPRYMVRPAFDVRRFEVDGHIVSDLTVRVNLTGDYARHADVAALWDRALSGVDEVFNRAGYFLPDGSVLHVTLERANGQGDAHVAVEVAGVGVDAHQNRWPIDAPSILLAHEIAHSLGLPDEYASADGQIRGGVVGSITGDFWAGLTGGGMRPRFLQLVHSHIEGAAAAADAGWVRGETADGRVRWTRGRVDDTPTPTAPHGDAVMGTDVVAGGSTTHEVGPGPSEVPARKLPRDSSKGKVGKAQKQSKADKAALHDKGSSAGPDPRLRKLLVQPGYATGDQFGIAATLLGDKNMHVVVVTDPSDARDKGPDMVDFYVGSGIDPERVILKEAKKADTKKLAMDVWRALNAAVLVEAAKPSNRQMDDLVIPVGAGTTWIGENFHVGLRDAIRAAWKLNDQGFQPQDREKVADWLQASKGIVLAPGQEVIVLWSRFSGKRGDVHVEHDTSFLGMDQLLNAIRARITDRDPGPLVLIAGDAKVNPQHRDRYPDMTARHRADGLDVHDLTDFWKDVAAVRPWGGHTRIGQMRLYEYLRDRSGDRLKHLGFRSGNLEGLALSGHAVRYLEEPGSIGGSRMEKWHAVNTTAPLATGYERIEISRPPTVSGQIAVEARNSWTEAKRLGTLDRGQLNDLAREFEHPGWVPGRANAPLIPKPVKAGHTKGFAPVDVDTIADYLVPQGSPGHSTLTERLEIHTDGPVVSGVLRFLPGDISGNSG